MGDELPSGTAAEGPPESPRGTVYRFGVYELSRASRELRRQGHLVQLTAKPFEVLCLLVEAAPDWLSRDDIVERAWGRGNLVSDASINQVILRIRKALRDPARSPVYVESGREHGYRFIAAVSLLATERGSENPTSATHTGGDPTTAPAVDRTPSSREAESSRLPIPRPSRWSRTRLLAMGAILALAAVVLVIVAHTDWSARSRFHEARFDFGPFTNSMTNLRQLSFEILNPDLGTWTTAPPGTGLVLRTERGDFWRKADDPVMPPRNIVVRTVRSSSFTVTTELVGFRPYSEWQQAGIVLLEGNELGNYVRLTTAYSRWCPDSSIAVQAVGEVREIRFLKTTAACLTGDVDRIWLQIERRTDVFRFRYKTGEEYWDWHEIEGSAVDAPLEPKYVGLTAFQGVTSPERKPKDQASVEARFGQLVVTSLQ